MKTLRYKAFQRKRHSMLFGILKLFRKKRGIRYFYNSLKKRMFPLAFKALSISFVVLFASSQVLLVSAFEAHVINVTARIINIIPTVEPGGDYFCDNDFIDINITSEFNEASIIYTLDGSNPECPGIGIGYSGPFTIHDTLSLKTVACYDGKQSDVVEEYFEFSPEYCPCYCGDGNLDTGEQCDDGNNIDGDGCSAECTYECEVRVCTQTIGGWGSRCEGENVGCMRDNYWQHMFGADSLLVGRGYFLTFTDSEKIRNYLPDGGRARVLTEDYINPIRTESKILGSQITALKLNVLYSGGGIGLIGSTTGAVLGEYLITEGKFISLSVYEFLNIAEDILGGGTTSLAVYDASVSDFNDTATSINENFVDCSANNGYLTLGECEAVILEAEIEAQSFSNTSSAISEDPDKEPGEASDPSDDESSDDNDSATMIDLNEETDEDEDESGDEAVAGDTPSDVEEDQDEDVEVLEDASEEDEIDKELGNEPSEDTGSDAKDESREETTTTSDESSKEDMTEEEFTSEEEAPAEEPVAEESSEKSSSEETTDDEAPVEESAPESEPELQEEPPVEEVETSAEDNNTNDNPATDIETSEISE